MSETSAAASVRQQQNLEAATMPEIVVALEAISDIIETVELINAYFAEHVLPKPIRLSDDPAELQCQYARLCNMEAFTALALVWKQSKYVPDEELTRAGLSRPRGQRGITRHALGLALKASARRPSSYDTADKYMRRAGRIVQAAITYGLIERDDEDEDTHGNYKALQGTERLHNLMLVMGDAIDLIIRALRSGE
jgi:hypothetical protein